MTKKEMEILEWHYAGKKHSWICRRYGITKRDIEELILQHGKGEK